MTSASYKLIDSTHSGVILSQIAIFFSITLLSNLCDNYTFKQKTLGKNVGSQWPMKWAYTSYRVERAASIFNTYRDLYEINAVLREGKIISKPYIYTDQLVGGLEDLKSIYSDDLWFYTFFRYFEVNDKG